jgi:F-type H+-transporting ATPase subunit b
MRLATLCRLCALALFAVLVLAAPALAADAHGSEGKGGGILDKMEFTGIKRWDLGLYTLIVFGILMFVLSKFAWPHIRVGLEAREAKIIGALEQAKKDQTEAAELLARAKKEIDATAAKVRDLLDEARKDAEVLKAAKMEEGARDAQAERERARKEADADRTALAKDVQQQAVELAVLIAAKAIGQQLTIDHQGRLLDESIAELKQNANRA